MLVAEVMTTTVVTCGFDDSLRVAASAMLDHGIGSVIVERDGTPHGIVTETDAVHAGVATDRPFADIAVEEVVSHPLVTTTGDVTVRAAVNRMTDHDIKKLPVVEGPELKGIVTLTDIVSHYGDFIREAHAIDRRRERWEARRTDIDEF